MLFNYISFLVCTVDNVKDFVGVGTRPRFRKRDKIYFYGRKMLRKVRVPPEGTRCMCQSVSEFRFKCLPQNHLISCTWLFIISVSLLWYTCKRGMTISKKWNISSSVGKISLAGPPCPATHRMQKQSSTNATPTEITVLQCCCCVWGRDWRWS